MVMFELTPDRKKLLETQGHILVLGGPGSGKTTIALIKADHEIQSDKLELSQRILFLSFARATIAQVAQQAGKFLSGPERDVLEINTYHGFAWSLLKSHGYLLKSGERIRLLPPPEAAARLADTDVISRPREKRRIFDEEGLLHFDLFAALGTELISRSQALRKIICDTYPIIILDEFQDTNLDEWQMIQTLGKRSTLIALADPDQRIYEFRGADPKRIGEFITRYSPTPFDFGLENNRSNGTDIVVFGNDLLTEVNTKKNYNDVVLVHYGFYKGRSAHYAMKVVLIKAIKRLKSEKDSWSLAVLVPTKRLMLHVSDYLTSNTDCLPALSHDVALDTEAPSLAAMLIAGILEGSTTPAETSLRLITDLCTYIRGRKGGNAPPNRGELELVVALGSYLKSGVIRGKKREQIVGESIRIAEQRYSLQLSGDPWEDWLAILRLLAGSNSEVFRQVAEDAKYLRLLRKGGVLRSRLGEIWRTTTGYLGAPSVVRDSLLQEHFSTSTKEWRGVHVMTIHKAKGKEFDEVIVYEDMYQARIVKTKASERDVAQARLALRVAVTRAMKRATILTPKKDVCRLLT